MDDFESLLNQSFKALKGGVVHGKVIKVTDREVFVDFGWKSDGVIPLRDLDKVPKIGETIDACIEELETDEGYTLLSVTHVESVKNWEDVVDRLNQDGIVEGKIVQMVRGGYKVDIGNDITVFLPMSQVNIMPVVNPDRWLGKVVKCKVLSIDRRRKSIVISRRKFIEEKRAVKRDETLKVVNEGDVVEGIVRNVVDFGIFVDIKGVDGLIHKSDISWSNLKLPFDVAKIGDTVKVKVKKVDRRKKRLVLSLKDLIDDPWNSIDRSVKEGQSVNGIVKLRIKDGFLIELPLDVAGFIDLSEIPDDVKLRDGKEYEFFVKSIDKDNRRVVLLWPQKTRK